MPIVRIGTRLVYFAHVPKCAGASVERYLAERFGALAFLDRRHARRPAPERWTRGSPQHVAVADLARLFPAAFFDASFAVVRHPHDRLLSVFRYQRDIAGNIKPGARFSAWLDRLAGRLATGRTYLDNHARPMTDIVPDAAQVFRLEDGLEPVVGWLDGLAEDTGEPRHIGTHNVYRQRLIDRQRPAGAEVVMTDQDRALIARLYAADFDRFGYDPHQQGGPA